ncbi:MAG: T9SS type A sorting domain-containing protein [Cytophagaceae bacterium]|nr:T9SS type A sorting domain-containing protein [Cytophagaceae bacterium]
MVKHTSIFIFLLVACLHAAGQNYPWPQDVTYAFGFKPSAETQANMTTRTRNDYNQWKVDFVTTLNAGGFSRVKYPQASNFQYTASEGIGYGMLLAAYSADKTLFDQLYGYFNIKKNASGMMRWYTDWSGNSGGGQNDAATDGDEDIAFALIVAHCQWGSAGAINYRQQAITLINNIMTYAVDPVPGRLKPGDVYGGPTCVDPSYFTVAYYPYFEAITGDNRWTTVKNWCLNYFNSYEHATSGLFRDWSDDTGNPPSSCAGSQSNYAYDASRIPWRLATDYLWHGTTISRDAARKMVTWTRTSGPISGNALNFRDCLNWDGSGSCGGNSNNPIVGGMAVGAMTLDNTVPANVTWANNLYNENVARYDDWFYNRTMRLLYLFQQSGNFWPPSCLTSLPVTLIFFSGEKNNSSVALHWSTSSEINNSHFVIERSEDGVNFHAIGKVAGNGNSKSTINYSFTDYTIHEENYYRLLQIDFDGQINYSEIISVSSDKKDMLIYPNPFSGSCNIRIEVPADFEYSCIIYDLNGNEIKKYRHLADYELTIGSELAPGIYMCRIICGNNSHIIRRINKVGY